MARTDQQRYDETITFLKGFNKALGDEVDHLITDKAKAGKDISLEGGGYWYSGSDDQHKAVRSYLLCLVAYYRPPYGTRDDATYAIGLEKTRLHGKSLNQVKEEILYFLPVPHPTLEDVVKAAKSIDKLNGSIYGPIRTRKDDMLGPNPICYDGVAAWLYAAGFVSKRWFAKSGGINANNANRYIGTGQEVQPADWDKIPAGHIWNIHKKNDPTTCHWGVSLGNGKAAATNNTAESPAGKVNFEAGGGSKYGRFVFKEICDVLNKDTRYRLAGGQDHSSGINITVLQLNPSHEHYY